MGLRCIPPGSPQQQILDLREASDTIFITYDIQTSCDSDAALIGAQVEAEDVCDVQLAQSQGSVGLLTDLPELVIDKTARNESEPSGNTAPGFPELIYASAGDTVAFDIVVSNQGNAAVTNLFVTDTLPSNVTPLSANLGGHDQRRPMSIGAAPADLTLDVGDSKTFIVTGTVDATGCALENVNSAGANYGCGTSDICLGQPVVDSASLQTVPDPHDRFHQR